MRRLVLVASAAGLLANAAIDLGRKADYLDMERQFTALVERALKLPKSRRILALLSWHAEICAALRRVGIDPTPDEDSQGGTELE